MLTFEITSLSYFDNISLKILPYNNKMDIFRIYTKRAVEKCPLSTFQFGNFENRGEGSLQGVQQNCIHFCYLNFSASKGSRNSILDISQQPFLCRFKKYRTFYYLVTSGQRYFQNTTGKALEKLTFFVYC